LGDLEGGLADLTRAVEVSPEDRDSLMTRGITLLQNGRFPAALADFQRCVELQPQNAKNWLAVGRAALGLGDLADAELAFRRALALDRTTTNGLRWLATAHYERGDWRRAIEGFGEYLRLVPNGARSEDVRRDLARARANLAAAGSDGPSGP